MNVHLRAGMRSGVPIAIGFISSFIAVGIFLRQAGFDVLQTSAMTIGVFAGPAQYGIAQAIHGAPDFFSMVFLVAAINARFFVMAASLVDSFRGVSLVRILMAAPFLSASTFAATQVAGSNHQGENRFDFFVGVGIMGYAAAVLATVAGAFLVNRLPQISSAWLTMILPLYFCAQMGIQTKVPIRILAFLAGILLTLSLRGRMGVHAVLVSGVAVGILFEVLVSKSPRSVLQFLRGKK